MKRFLMTVSLCFVTGLGQAQTPLDMPTGLTAPMDEFALMANACAVIIGHDDRTALALFAPAPEDDYFFDGATYVQSASGAVLGTLKEDFEYEGQRFRLCGVRLSDSQDSATDRAAQKAFLFWVDQQRLADATLSYTLADQEDGALLSVCDEGQFSHGVAFPFEYEDDAFAVVYTDGTPPIFVNPCTEAASQ